MKKATRFMSFAIALTCLLGLPVTPQAFAGETADVSPSSGGKQAKYIVTDYGADGNDEIDDSSAIQSAIDEAGANGGGTVVVPAGTYLVSDLKLYSNIELKGAGWNSVLKQNSGTPGVHYVVSVNPGADGVGNPKSNIRIRDIQLMDRSGDGAGFSEHQHVLNINAATDVLVDRVKIAGFRGDGIYIGSGNTGSDELHNERITIRNSYIDGVTKNNRNGISIIDCDGCTIKNNHFVRTSRPDMPGAIDLEPDHAYSIVRNIAIQGNTFDDIGGSVGMISVILHHAQNNMAVPSENIRIENNRGENLTVNGRAIVVLQRQSQEPNVGNGIVIKNNSVTDSSTGGIGLFGVKGVTVENNRFANLQIPSYIGYDGMPTWDVTLKNNTFKETGTGNGQGINIFSTDRLTLEGNLFDNIGKPDNSYGVALQFIPADDGTPGQGSMIEMRNNKFRSSGRTTYAIKNSGYVFTDPSQNVFKNNQFLQVSGNDFQY